MKKRYWLRGLITGVVIYVFALIVVYILALGDEWGPGFAVMIAGIYFSPIIVLGLLVGWAWGNMKKMLIPILVLVMLLVTFLPLYNGRTVCGINPEKGCWNMKVNLIGYIRDMK